MSNGELYFLTNEGLEKITDIPISSPLFIEGKEYQVQILCDGSVQLTNISSNNNRKEIAESKLEQLRNELVKRKQDVSTLECDIEELMENATTSGKFNADSRDEMGNKSMLICKHKHEIRRIESMSDIKIKYIKTNTKYSFGLQSFVPKYIPRFNKEIVWCPIKSHLGIKKRKGNDYTTVELVELEEKQQIQSGNLQTLVLHESDVLTRNQKRSLWALLSERLGNSVCKKIFQASKDGWTSKDFHSACDKYQKTLTIVRANNCTFGGYNGLSWDGNASYKQASVDDAWLFSLDRNIIFPNMLRNTYCAIYCDPKYGPTWGGGHDLHIADMCNTIEKSRSSMRWYNKLNVTADARKILANKSPFIVSDYEVFVIS